MTTDTPKRSSQPSHPYSDRARQALTFSSAGTTDRSSRTTAVPAIKAACYAGLLLLLLLAGFSTLSRRRGSSQLRPRGAFESSALRTFGLSASNELRNCTASSTSPVCKWARKHSRANRKRPVNWEPKEGWPEDAEVALSVRYASDRTLAAVDNTTSSSRTTTEPLQNIVQSLRPIQHAPEVSGRQQSSLPQCRALHSQSCIAFIGNSNVSYQLQPELHHCVILQQLELVTSANCEQSAHVWLASQPFVMAILAAQISDNLRCSVQQVMVNTQAVWYLGGEQGQIQQVQSKEASLAGVPAIRFPDAIWNERYKAARTATATTGVTAAEPSPLWIGLMTVLECAMPSAQIHVFTPMQASPTSTLHDVASEAELLNKLHASGVIVLHEDCVGGVSCTAKAGGVTLRGNEGWAAPGVKLYLHRKKWQDASMRVYDVEEEDEDEEDA